MEPSKKIRKKTHFAQDQNQKKEEVFDIFQPANSLQDLGEKKSSHSDSSFELDVREQNDELKKKETIDKLLTRLGLTKKQFKKEKDQNLEMLLGNIVQNYVGTVDENANLQQYEKIYGAEYKEKLEEKKQKHTSIIVNELTQLEKIQLMNDKGFIGVIKQVRLFLKKTSIFCRDLVQHNLFETIILLIIILNSVKMALDDPLTEEDDNETIENVFIVLYTMEMILKIFAFGFLFSQKAYLRDLWNVLDFVIVVTSLLPHFIPIDFSVNSLRAIRVLRPLKTITKVKALKMIVNTLFHSFSLVMDSLYILIFVMIVFSIAGTQLFSGLLKNRCIELETGTLTETLCMNNDACQSGFACGKGIASPNFSITNFDTFLWSMLSVFRSLTMEGWSDIMIGLQRVYSPFSLIYSLLIVFFCEYVLLNMTLAILKYKYSQVKGNTIQQEQEEECQYEPEYLKKLKIFDTITKISEDPPLQRYIAKDKIFVGSIFFNKNNEDMTDDPLESDFKSLRKVHKKQTEFLKKSSKTNQKKISIEELQALGRVEEHKWDAKTLQFETLQFAGNQNQKKNDSQKSIQENRKEEEDRQKDVIEEIDSFSESLFDQSFEEEEDFAENDDMDQKILDVHKRLTHHPSEGKIKTDKSIYKTIKQIGDKITHEKNRHKVDNKKGWRKQLNELDNILGIVSETYLNSKKKLQTENEIEIPEINLQDLKMEKIYEKFNDLGSYRVKRSQQINQLDFFNIKQKKMLEPEKLQTRNIVRQISEENSLDIKELQLVNELSKKLLKCRIKKKEVLDTQGCYDFTRVLVSQKIQQAEKKQNQIDENMKSLKFNVTYKIVQSDDEEVVEQESIFRRNLNRMYKGLKIPEMICQKEKKDTMSRRSTKNIQSNNYLRMLQNHKMNQKIEFEEGRLMQIFFKKDRQTLKLSRQMQGKQPLQKQYNAIKQADIFNRHGNIVLTSPTETPLSQRTFESINIKPEQYEIYMKGISGFFNVIRKKTLLFITKSFYDNIMLLLVIANTVTLSLNGIVDTSRDEFIKLNYAFTVIFAADIALKIFSYGFDFFGDVMNIFDSFVVSISIVELQLGTGGSNLSALRSVRILRAFRVLRITRLIRTLNYMKIVMSVVSSVITEFVYIFMLLALFIFIYTLLGMQIFGGALLPESITGVRQNFDTFFGAAFSVFQVLTVENWNDIETLILTSPNGYLSVFYLISWIFIGNWILLNLLQAILLDGFDNDSCLDNEDEDQENQKPKEKQKQKTGISMQEDQQSNQREDVYENEDASLLMFYPTNCLRMISMQITKSPYFENCIILMIALSSIKLVADTYVEANSQLDKIFKYIDIFFNSIFILESVLKIISQGFIMGPNAYLKDSWSKLDFFIVITAIIDMSLVGIDLSILKLFRTLRPLRIVSRNPDMKVIISSLAQSMLGILNVIIIIICVFLMFGILGINLLQGKLGFCNESQQLTHNYYGPYGVSESDCLASGGVWTTQFINFDNIQNSLLSLYVFSTRENWPYYVYTFMDSNESTSGPTKDNSQLVYMVFAVVIIFICSYFFMDLLVGVLFMNFHQAQAKIRPKTLTDKQINWKNLQKIIIEEDPCFQLYLKPENTISQFFYNIVMFKLFDIFITLCILGNIVVMMVAMDDQTDQTTQTLADLNFAFSIVFICEMLLKLLAFGKAYFLSGWNIFDFFVVMASILDIILDSAGGASGASSALAILPQIARIFRVLRVTKLLRMFKRFKGLQKLIETFIFSMPALARGLSIVSLFLFISSVLASYLLGNIEYDYAGNIDDIRNFSDFHHSIQTLFIITTGQNWYFYMYESMIEGYVVCKDGTTSSCVDGAYLIFWLIYVFFSQKVFMELFVLIVLDQFEANYINQNNPLGIFALFEEDFRTKWIQHTTKYHSQKIETKKLVDLLLALKQPLGLGKEELMRNYEDQLRENEKITEDQVFINLRDLDLKLKKNAAKLIHKMDIIKNKIYLGYHETFYHFAKLSIVSQFINDATEQQRQILDELHRNSEEKLLPLMPEGNNQFFQEDGEQETLENLNPIELILFTQMILKSWHNYSLKFHSQAESKQKKNKEKQGNNSLNNSCASDIIEAAVEKIPYHKMREKRKGFREKASNDEKGFEFKHMPNIDDHYQNQKKRLKKPRESRRSQIRGSLK